MNHTTIEPALCALIATLTGLDPAYVVFQNAAQPTGWRQRVTLSWVALQGVGTDESRWVYAANANPLLEMTPTVEGPRAATLQLSFDSTDQRPGYTGHHLAELVRTRLMRPSALATLAAADLALGRIGDILTADYKADGRWISRCVLDVRLNGKASEADLDGRTSYIATVQATATVTRPDGATLDTDLQPTLS